MLHRPADVLSAGDNLIIKLVVRFPLRARWQLL